MLFRVTLHVLRAYSTTLNRVENTQAEALSFAHAFRSLLSLLNRIGTRSNRCQQRQKLLAIAFYNCPRQMEKGGAPDESGSFSKPFFFVTSCIFLLLKQRLKLQKHALFEVACSSN
ncbi:unnamed protein product [Amoebophrya sp. A25]|nr:unnamed protein product [Amoebophrya sp. A25]|eukprot:GSA25T00007739001.1